jgi:uncharacterized protein YndB with AHSA1/START domain
MAIASTQAPAALRITRTLAASRERVFRAWTDPRALSRWFAPTQEFRTTVLEHEARVGGRYRIEMRIGERVYLMWGVFRELAAPERLSFTWQWNDTAAGGDAGDSLVTTARSGRNRRRPARRTRESSCSRGRSRVPAGKGALLRVDLQPSSRAITRDPELGRPCARRRHAR